MLVTPKNGTACLTLTLVVDATVIVMVSPQNDHCLLQIISRCRSRIPRKPAGIKSLAAFHYPRTVVDAVLALEKTVAVLSDRVMGGRGHGLDMLGGHEGEVNVRLECVECGLSL